MFFNFNKLENRKTKNNKLFTLTFFLFYFINLSSAGTEPVTLYTKTLHIESNNIYYCMVPNGEEKDHWFMSVPYGTGETRGNGFTINDYKTGEDCTIRLRFQGKGTDHSLTVGLNGTSIGNAEWIPETDYLFTHTSQNLLINGKNAVRNKPKIKYPYFCSVIPV